MSAPAAAVSPDGKKTVFAWMDKRADGADANVFWAVADGIAVKEDRIANDDRKGEQDHPAAAWSPDGETAYVVWEDRRSGGWQIHGTSTALEGRNVLLSGRGDAQFPAIACGGGIVAVVYEIGERAVGFSIFPSR